MPSREVAYSAGKDAQLSVRVREASTPFGEKMKLKYTIPALTAVAALALTGCVNNAAEETGGSEAAADIVSKVEVDQAAADALPADIKDSGKLIIGTDAAYPPNEFKDPEGNPTGWNVSVAEAVAAKLGLEPDWQISGFDSIIPKLQGGEFNMGSSSFTDTLERQESVDFIDYYNAGTLWAAPVDSDVDPTNACGLKVAVQTGTIQDEEVSALAEQCAADGKDKLEVMKFDDQAKATNAVVSGQADAMSADSPVVGDAIANANGELKEVGELTDAAPYGFVVAKDSGLQEAIQLAVQSLMDDGTYEEILKEAGVDAGALDSAEINSVKE